MMEADYTELLRLEIERFHANLVDAMLEDERRATGATIASLRTEAENGQARLYGAGQFLQLQFGRGPTAAGAPAGTPTLLDAIKAWIAAKGLTLNPWAVTKKIHKLGTALHLGEDYRWPGRRESTTLARVVNPQTLGAMAARLATAARNIVTSEILNIFK